MAAAQDLIDRVVARAVAEFETNPLSREMIRHLSKDSPEQFCETALKYLQTDECSDAHRFLSALMLRQPSRYERLMNPRYGSKERAIHLFRRLLAVDPSFDLKLARRLPDGTVVDGGSYESLRAARAIEILDATSPGRRLLPILGQLVHSKDARISEKATLFVGRRLQSTEWAARQIKHGAPRLRANAVESIWGLKSLSAKVLLETCLTDSNNRVKGNALVGLHLIGESWVLDQVGLLASNSLHQFRSTAAWAMGRIGDPCFVQNLTALLKDEHPQARGAALRSLIEIRRIESKRAYALAALNEQEPEAGRKVV